LIRLGNQNLASPKTFDLLRQCSMHVTFRYPNLIAYFG